MKSAKKQAKDVIRSHARRYAKSLLREFGGLCAWCDREIIRPEQVTGTVLKRTANAITWVKDGQVVVSVLSTVDHLTPISDGGPSKRWNLVPACRTCNSKRQHPQHFKRFLLRETVWRLRERIVREQFQREKCPQPQSIVYLNLARVDNGQGQTETQEGQYTTSETLYQRV